MEDDIFKSSGYVPVPMSGKVSWKSPSNIALVKYWGKYGEQLPKNSSISFTLRNCHTKTSLSFRPKTSEGFEFEILLAGKKEDSFKPKIQQFFERSEKYLPFLRDFRFTIETENSFPHSSGIASSASGMSALALCLVEMELILYNSFSNPNSLSDKDIKKASFLSRLGSGSACRSIEAPLIVWGEHSDIDASTNLLGTKYPYKIHPDFLTYRDCILLVDKGEKQVSSTVGHDLMYGHPFAEQRFREANENMSKLIPVLATGDIGKFVEIVESEALTLHAMMMTSLPYFILMKPNTLEIIQRIWNFRKEYGSNACFTLDAGANVHLLYPQTEELRVLRFIKEELSPFCKNGEFIVDEVGGGATRF